MFKILIDNRTDLDFEEVSKIINTFFEVNDIKNFSVRI